MIAFRIISGYVIGPLLRLATSWQQFQQVALSIERLSDVVDAKAEGDGDAEPPETHERYDALNAILRGRFAIVALRGLLAAGEPIELAAKLLKGCGRRKLELGFEGVEAFDANAMQTIAQNLTNLSYCMQVFV